MEWNSKANKILEVSAKIIKALHYFWMPPQKFVICLQKLGHILPHISLTWHIKRIRSFWAQHQGWQPSRVVLNIQINSYSYNLQILPNTIVSINEIVLKNNNRFYKLSTIQNLIFLIWMLKLPNKTLPIS